MAPVARKRGKKDRSEFDFHTVLQWMKSLFLDPKNTWIIGLGLFCAEIVANILVVWKIRYTEIDWQAYMQEVEGVINGTYNYYELKGDTGPLVYPAGFVYFFGGLYYLTNKGIDVRTGQYIFIVLYLLTLAIVFTIYQKTAKVPPYAFIFMCCGSYRIHSIYILRLFNDPVAMFFLYVAVLCFIYNQWNIGCLFFSLGVSIKMNILLFAPGLLLVLLMTFGVWYTIPRLAICGIIQLLLGLPFLLGHPVAYLAMSFNLGRQFLFQWTVNWRFLPEWLFVNRYFHITLLLLHVGMLLCFYHFIWTRKCDSIKAFFKTPFKSEPLSADKLVLILFTSNFIGVAFSRSLHYQFYVWYFHTLPYLLWNTRLWNSVRILILGLIEMCWNTYPSTCLSSCTLHVCHVVLLLALWYSGRRNITKLQQKVQ